MGSHSNVGPGRVRVTYVEEGHVASLLQKLAEESGLTTSNLLRQAAWEYLKSHRKMDEPVIRRDEERRKKKKS